MELGQSIDRFGEEIGTRVRHLVPLLEHRDVADAKVRGEIDDLYVGVHQPARLRHCHAVRCREEHHVAGPEVGRIGRGELQLVVVPAQAREHVDDSGAGFSPGRNRAHVSLRMRCQQPQEFDVRRAGIRFVP